MHGLLAHLLLCCIVVQLAAAEGNALGARYGDLMLGDEFLRDSNVLTNNGEGNEGKYEDGSNDGFVHNNEDQLTSGEGLGDGDQEDDDEDPWLEDFDAFPGDEMQSDAPSYLGTPAGGTCPPVPEEPPEGSCLVVPCTYDVECSLMGEAGTLCCDNGCVKTCLKPMAPPPYIDWRKRLMKLRQTGFSWLLKEDKYNGDGVDWCSTSTLFSPDHDDSDDDDPTLCPHGYACHIEYPGNSQQHIPNRGHCVPTDPKDFAHRVRFEDTSVRQLSQSSCSFHDKVLHDGQTFTYHGHPCSCSSGAVLCNVALNVPQS